MRRLPKGIPAAGKKPRKYIIIHTAKNSTKRAKGEKITLNRQDRRRTTAPERRCSSRTFRYGYLVTT